MPILSKFGVRDVQSDVVATVAVNSASPSEPDVAAPVAIVQFLPAVQSFKFALLDAAQPVIPVANATVLLVYPDEASSY